MALAERFGVEEHAFMLGDEGISLKQVAHVTSNIMATQLNLNDAGLREAIRLFQGVTQGQKLQRMCFNVETGQRVKIATGFEKDDFIEIPPATTKFHVSAALVEQAAKNPTCVDHIIRKVIS